MFGQKLDHQVKSLKKSYVPFWSHISSPGVLLKVGHNVFLDDISHMFENGLCWV